MQTFLTDIAKKIIDSNQDLSQVKIVVPSIRAIKFLKKALENEISGPTLAPKIVSIEQFINELSAINKVSNLDLLFIFYKVYQEHTPEKEQNPLNQFLNWAPALLQEFNEIDVQLVDANSIFSFMGAVEQIEQWEPKKMGDLSKQFFKFQERVPIYYNKLYKVLQSQQLGYSGLQYREATQNLGHYIQPSLPFHYFIGFNALTKAEEVIIQELIAEEKATVLWDLDQYFYEEPSHSTSYFIKNYIKEWAFLKQEFTSQFSNFFSKNKKIEIINVSKNLLQAKAAAQLAVETYREFPNDSIVLVLGDEGLLHPVLTYITSTEVPWNVSMGYPFKNFGIVTFFVKLFELLKTDTEGSFSLSTVNSLLENNDVLSFIETSGLPIKKIVKRQQALRSSSLSNNLVLGKSSAGDLIFSPFETPVLFLERMLRLSEMIKDHLILKNSSTLEIHCLTKISKLWNKALTLSLSNPELRKLQDIELVFLKLLDKETLDFSGDPFAGIQIMGVLETRVLDFDHVIVTHLNEGILPLGKTPFSWIPFDVRKKYGLNTFIEQDHLYAYHFFRLLQRAKRISLIYNESAEGLFSAEKSRFLIQLEYFKRPNHKLRFKYLSSQLEAQKKDLKKAIKTSAVIRQLKEVGIQGFSPSSLVQYIRDPYLFYEQRLLKIEPDDTFEMEINAAEKGTLIHEVLERLYQPYIDQILTEKDYEGMLKILPKIVDSSFKKQEHRESLYVGKNYLIFEVTTRVIKEFLEKERDFIKKGNTLVIKTLESQFYEAVFVPELNQKIFLKGTVDRIDTLNGVTRIVDYKTGNITSSDMSFDSWEELITVPNKGALFQVMLYAYALKNNFTTTTINAGVIPLKNFDNTFLGVHQKKERNKQPLLIDSMDLNCFENVLFKLLIEIFNVQKPFEQIPIKG
ncbi:MAG: PD-(D/E)XK nuclease family protein [Flavobacteriaceae bacterium]|nr:PD-(D/E)XK nuclease family protein [Flavobacteriaceae bacterium]